MTTTFHALWMLCALGVVVHAATAAHRVRDVTALAVGFVLATIVARPQRLPDPLWVGALSAGVAIAVLCRPRFAVLAAGWGGALGGMLTALTEVQGVPAAASVGPVVVLIATVVWLTRLRPSFAPDPLRDEALLAITLLGLVVSVMPGVIDGWQAAATLTIEPATSGPVTPVPAWTLTLVGTATALGAVHALWSRR